MAKWLVTKSRIVGTTRYGWHATCLEVDDETETTYGLATSWEAAFAFAFANGGKWQK